MFTPAVLAAAVARHLGLIDRHALKQTMHRLLLGPLPADRAVALADDFERSFGARHILPAARARVAADRAAGYRIVIASAAYRFYAEPLVRPLAVDAIIATEVETDAAGIVRPAIAGDNCYGPAKLRMIRRWMTDAGIAREDAHVRFYTDHVSDRPTLEWADEAFAVNPHRPLRELAQARGWPIIDWRG